jgi:hypothetical protein
MSATLPTLMGEDVEITEIFERIDAALAQLEAGLPL